MELILHLGAHRTGTTALQQTCRRNAQVLTKNHAAMLPSDVLRGADYATFPNKFNDNGVGDEDAIASLDAVFSDIAGSGVEQLLVSEENLIGTMLHNVRSRELYPDAKLRLTAYRSLFANLPERIFIGVRDYASFWASSYAFTSQRHALLDFAKIAGDLQNATRGWPDLIADVRSVFPESELVIWPHQKSSDQLRQNLTQVFGDAGQKLVIQDRFANSGISDAAVAYIRGLRAQNPKIDFRDVKAMVDATSKADPAPFQPFDLNAVGVMNDRYEADLSEIFKMQGVSR